MDREHIPPKKDQFNTRLDPEVIALLHSYCEFIASSQHYVVEQSLRYTFRKDRVFKGSLRLNGTTGGQQNASTKQHARFLDPRLT